MTESYTDTPPRWALITGAAKRIGAAIATKLHQEGWNVFIHCHHSVDEAQRLADVLCQKRAGSAQVICADLVQADSTTHIRHQIVRSGASLALLVNNASRFDKDPANPTLAHAQTLMGVNCLQPYLLAFALAPLLASAQGSVINLCDIHGQRPLRQHGLYSISKAALAMATLSLAQELAPAVRVNGIAPGAILWPETAGAKPNKVLAEIPLARAGAPSDIANLVSYLANADYISGQIIAVDGGRSATGYLGAG
ncbi:SDR family oxidoreductase [Shewanella amazonensis]|uniref:Short-chain dehydrogenase/reductase SDR n=1 Tax=Shewanella amazonensis (strain ATCC BAA-1098 / SB2B) TaxID=326297 RepID=A1S6G3_SHEAM|nr:SDR family oxidoreductase [Shewanella amazonensis]ABL99969.1 short-chain dehydrogenase/reductase SDR [Shewanella amazonensis SB2B]